MKERSFSLRSLRWLSAAILLGASCTVAADGVELSEASLEEMGPDAYFELGQEVTGQVCTMCHGWDVVLSSRLTPSQWEFLVSDMIARGASASNEQQEFIARFMTWAWGTVSVNSAPAEDLQAVIGIPMEQAEAVVAYREENGAFAGLDELKEVPGIDTAVLDQQADALQFN